MFGTINLDMNMEVFNHVPGTDLIPVREVSKDAKNFVDSYFQQMITPVDRLDYRIKVVQSKLENCSVLESQMTGLNDAHYEMIKIRDKYEEFIDEETDTERSCRNLKKKLLTQIQQIIMKNDSLKSLFTESGSPNRVSSELISKILDKTNLELIESKSALKNLKKEQSFYQDRILTLKREKENIEISLKREKIESETLEMVYHLFNGKENFDNLPVLDLNPILRRMGRRENEDCHPNFVSHIDLTAPLMRGVYGEKRYPFFAIKEDQAETVGCYFLVTTGHWCYCNSNDTVPETFIYMASVEKENKMLSLQELIKKHSAIK